MSRKVFIEAFYSQFHDFVMQLKNMYPDDTDFPVFLETINLMKLTNPMLIINFMKTDVIDLYKDKIIARDETFFVNTEIVDTTNIDIITKLKEYISSMSPETKVVVWDYVNLLVKLCEKILG